MNIRPNSGKVPVISKYASLTDVFSIFSNDLVYPDRVKWDMHNGLLRMCVSNPDSPAPDFEVEIPSSFFDPNCRWPSFVYCTRHINKNVPLEMLSHLELLFIAFKERLDDAVKHPEVFSTYIRRDIEAIKDFVEYTHKCAYNAELKASNVVVLLNPYRSNTGGVIEFRKEVANRPLGDALYSKAIMSISKEVIVENAKFFNLYPGSETMLSKSNKLVVAVDEFSREPTATGFELAYNEEGDVNGYYTIFPVKSALPARLKTHLNGDAFRLEKPDEVIFLQDLIRNEDNQLVTKDSTFRNALMVYEKIDEDSYRMVAGDIEVSPRIGREIVLQDRHIETEFDGPESLLVEEGKEYFSKGGVVKLGTYNGVPVIVDGVYKIFIKEIKEVGFSEAIRIDYTAYYKAGNARITSHTGLKGVTKVMQDCGDIEFVDKDGNLRFERVDIVCGVNSIKAKENTVRLAQAAFAVKYGFYVPKNGTHLDSLDEEEINTAAASIPKIKYKVNRADKVEIRETKLYGIVQIQYTELGSHFAYIKDQKLSFNALRYIDQTKESPLSEIILNNFIVEEDKEAVMEIAKCLHDKNTTFAAPEKKEVYTLKEIGKMFKTSDLILDHSTLLPHMSRLLNEEFNKGFYINLGAQRQGKYVRVPPAKIINRFCGKQTDGKYVYPGIVVEISKIIRAAIEGQDSYYQIIPKRSERNQDRPCAYKHYKIALKAMLYKTELGGQTLIQTMIVPRLKGVNLKQVHDIYVPEGVTVILDHSIYNQLHKYVHGGNKEYKDASIVAFTLRNPFLWKTQTVISQVWDEKRFNQYLLDTYGFELKDYLDVQSNRYCILHSKSLNMQSHSDGDGDLVQLTTLPGAYLQKLMKEFKLSNVTERMLAWDENFLHDEWSSIEKLDWKTPYKVYYCNAEFNKPGDCSYPDLLTNSAMAKNAVGQ